MHQIKKAKTMEVKEKIIGDFELIPEGMPAEGDVYIRLKPIDLIAYWKRCGMLANFAAAFYAYTQDRPRAQENSISTVFNELIENATKYSTKRGAEVSVHMMLYDQVLKISIENLTTDFHYNHFQTHLSNLLSSDNLEDLYIETLANKMEGSTDSGIGLLLIMKDYPVKMGAKFIEKDDKYIVRMNVYYTLD